MIGRRTHAVVAVVALSGATMVAAVAVQDAAKPAQPTAPQDAPAQVPELNLKVVKFAEANKDKQVGNGQCWTLAAEALTASGAQRPGADGVGVMVFGRKLGEKEAPLPGDIIQFDKAFFVRKDAAGKKHTMTFPKHTAIIVKVDGSTLGLLHQNFAGKKTVQPCTVNLSEKSQGTVEIFRPRPKSGAVPAGKT